ncbi:hypothetical protein, partial [Ileibacterium valens]
TWGAGRHEDITQCAILALVSAINNRFDKDVRI